MKDSIFSMPIRIALLLCITLMTSASSSAVEHAAFHRALPELRAARWLIMHQPGGWKQIWPEEAAGKHIQNAIEEMNRLNITDSKALDDHSTIEDNGERLARLRKAVEILRKVRSDIKRGEDSDYGNNLQERVIGYIDKAITFTVQAINGK